MSPSEASVCTSSPGAARTDTEAAAAGENRRCKLGRTSVERHVETRVELVLDEEVREDAEQHDDCAERGRRREHDAPAERHGSLRSTYPTPRTVWMSLGRPDSSSLRRR